MPEWLVALVILVAVCAIGVYYVNSFHGLVPEGFSEEPYTAPYEKLERDPSEQTKIPPTEIPEPADDIMPAPLSLDPRLQTFLQTIKGNNMSEPTGEQLSIVQGDQDANANANANAASTYKPAEQRIRPHMIPEDVEPFMEARVASDVGTAAEKIQESAPLTPSVRQMIRNDNPGKKADNDYEVRYE